MRNEASAWQYSLMRHLKGGEKKAFKHLLLRTLVTYEYTQNEYTHTHNCASN